MVTPITYREPVDRPHVAGPYPLGELRADDVRDAGFLMAVDVPLPPLSALPNYKYYGLYDESTYVMTPTDTKSIIQNTPLNQMRCHAYQDRTRPDPLGCGHCVGFMIKHLLLAHPVVNRAVELTGSDFYHDAQRNWDEWVGHAYQGTSVRAGLKAAQAKGYITAYVWGDTPATVAQWLLNNMGVVAIGTSWFTGMDSPSSANGYRIKPEGVHRGGHAYIIDGVNQVTKLFRILNSWGRWGQGGRAWITWDDLAILMRERPQAAASAVEVRREGA